MTDGPHNLFERYDLDPREGPEAITARMRELVQEAPEEERERLRADWEALTLHPRDRLQHALEAFPETRAEVETPPPRVRRRRQELALELSDVVVTPSVAEALACDAPEGLPDPLPPLADDPILEDA